MSVIVRKGTIRSIHLDHVDALLDDAIASGLILESHGGETVGKFILTTSTKTNGPGSAQLVTIEQPGAHLSKASGDANAVLRCFQYTGAADPVHLANLKARMKFVKDEMTARRRATDGWTGGIAYTFYRADTARFLCWLGIVKVES